MSCVSISDTTLTIMVYILDLLSQGKNTYWRCLKTGCEEFDLPDIKKRKKCKKLAYTMTSFTTRMLQQILRYVIKSRRMWWVGHVTRKGGKRNVYISVTKYKGKKTLGRLRMNIWEDNTDMQIGCEDLDSYSSGQVPVCGSCGLMKYRNFLTTWATNSFSRTHLHGVGELAGNKGLAWLNLSF